VNCLKRLAWGFRVLELIEVFDRIYAADGASRSGLSGIPLSLRHCGLSLRTHRGELRAGSDVTDVMFAREDELGSYHLTETATRILKKAFAMDRARRGTS